METESTSGSSTLSIGAVIGIVVAIVFLIILALIALIFRKEFMSCIKSLCAKSRSKDIEKDAEKSSNCNINDQKDAINALNQESVEDKGTDQPESYDIEIPEMTGIPVQIATMVTQTKQD